MLNPVTASKHQLQVRAGSKWCRQGTHHIPSLVAQELKHKVNGPEATPQSQDPLPMMPKVGTHEDPTPP